EQEGLDMAEIGESAYDFIDELVKTNMRTGVTTHAPQNDIQQLPNCGREVEMGGNQFRF
ncbi:11100_t:CDS:1, partial [Ambispora leptoticha]